MSALERRLADLEDYVVELARVSQDAQRRLANVVRMGRVEQVDAAKGVVKVVWGKNEDGDWAPGLWMPWATRAGKIKDWNPPSVGEQVMLFSPNGHIGPDSWAMPGGYSNDHKPNHNQDGQRKINVGANTEILMTEDSVTIRTKSFKIQADTIEQRGTKIEHNKAPLSADPPTPDAGGPVSGDVPTS